MTESLGMASLCVERIDNNYYLYTGLFEIIVGVLTTCHTQYT